MKILRENPVALLRFQQLGGARFSDFTAVAGAPSEQVVTSPLARWSNATAPGIMRRKKRNKSG